MYVKDIKQQAISLRNEGYSYQTISKRLSIPKSTLSKWLGGFVFVPNEISRKIIENGQKKSSAIKSSQKALSLEKAIKYAESLGNLSDRDILLLGIGIYIGEGSKTANVVMVSNSDPRIIKFAIKWFNVLGIDSSHLKIRVHIYPDNDKNKVLEYWINQTGLCVNNFHPCYIDERKDKKDKKKNVLPHGTAHLNVLGNGDKDLGVLLHRKILASIDFVLKI
jgi:hypothetical protein